MVIFVKKKKENQRKVALKMRMFSRLNIEVNIFSIYKVLNILILHKSRYVCMYICNSKLESRFKSIAQDKATDLFDSDGSFSLTICKCQIFQVLSCKVKIKTIFSHISPYFWSRNYILLIIKYQLYDIPQHTKYKYQASFSFSKENTKIK